MKLDKKFLTALYESQNGQQKQQKPVVKLNQAKVDEDLIEKFIEWYNKENREETVAEDWDFEKESDKVHVSSKEYNEEYDIYDDYDSAKDVAFENFKAIFDDLGWDLFNKSKIGYISSYLTDDAEEELRKDAENDLYDQWNDEMSDSFKQEFADDEDFDWEADDADQLYADAILSKYRYPSEYWEELLGEEDFEKMCKENPDWLDMEKLFNEIVMSDDIGSNLNSYDGNYSEAGDYIIVRVG